eukprot:TRINITY_DN3895_c0_g1_i1.p1 TRINITY_DN3895_c0_g1~~TRINITY_DN3895_c0_g1_i1.p1  ORF type:complete len:122 (+),score=25.92 TRINITY_DN3895_c0_g1_i1:775-1140(+)
MRMVKLPKLFAAPEYLLVKEGDSDETRKKKKKKIKALKAKHTILLGEPVRNNRKNNWLKFNDGKKKKKKSQRYRREKRSIFASPDSVEGKVGVTNSGHTMTNYIPQDKHHGLRKDPNSNIF